MNLMEHHDVTIDSTGYVAVIRTWRGYAASQRSDPRWHGTPRFARTGFYGTEQEAIDAIIPLLVDVTACGARRPHALPKDDMGI